MVKEKDVFSRANFKLIQLLELKEQAIREIVRVVNSGGEVTQLSTFLGGEQLLEGLLSRENKEKLSNPRERVRLVGEWLTQK